MRVMFISAEVAPFAKTGGLGDVAGSLPLALKEQGHDVCVVMPAYRNIEQGEIEGFQPMEGALMVPAGGSWQPAGVFEGRLPNSDVPVYAIAEWNLFNRDRVYGYDDDPYRFAFFSRAAFELMHALGWYPDILHANDWHTCPTIFWLKTAGQLDARLRHIRTLLTIHNLGHQGITSWDITDYLHLQTHSLNEESYGSVNLMARGIYHADAITTVSPTYTSEIMTPEGGWGLEGLLRYRENRLFGIVNGIDTDVWNPATDDRLPYHFDAQTLEKRDKVRHALQDYLGLPRWDDVPLVALISRLDYQKGLDITGEVVERLMTDGAGKAQFVVLGSGAAEYEEMFRQLESKYGHKMRAILKYNAGLAPLIYGGSDIFLMPSRFEPCGLSQILSMRYGCLPVVRATGGLVDTVDDGVTGFKFDEYSVEAFWQALARTISIYNTDKLRWRWMQEKAMMRDLSWSRSAKKYSDLYSFMLQ